MPLDTPVAWPRTNPQRTQAPNPSDSASCPTLELPQWEEGWAEGLRGALPEENPYRHGTPEQESWEEGRAMGIKRHRGEPWRDCPWCTGGKTWNGHSTESCAVCRGTGRLKRSLLRENSTPLRESGTP